jgi:hypothetical protein
MEVLVILYMHLHVVTNPKLYMLHILNFILFSSYIISTEAHIVFEWDKIVQCYKAFSLLPVSCLDVVETIGNSFL